MCRSFLSAFIVLLCLPQPGCQQSRKTVPADAHSAPRGVWTIEWSPDDAYVAVAGDDSTIHVYNGNDHTLYRRYHPGAMVKCISWHPTKTLLAIATHRNTQLLDLRTGGLTVLKNIAGGRAIGWNFDGSLLALADGTGVVRIINSEGQLLRSIPKHNSNTYLTLDWHPSRNILVTGSDEIIIFDTTGKQLNMFRHRTENTGLMSLSWHPSGAFFASSDHGHDLEGIPTQIRFWKEDGTLLRTLTGNRQECRTIRWNRDGSLLASAADSLRIWTPEGQLLHAAGSNEQLWALAWNQKGDRLVTSSYGDQIDLWDNKASLISTISRR